MRYPRFFSLALLVVGLVMVFSLSGLAAADEYGAQGTIPGVTFTGGDGSYKRVVREGILLGISADFPWTYLDQKTKQYDGVDVSIFKEVTRRLGITKVTYQIMPYDGLIPALQSKRIDVIVDNIHENPKRLVVIDFTGPSYFYGSAVSTQKGESQENHYLGVAIGEDARRHSRVDWPDHGRRSEGPKGGKTLLLLRYPVRRSCGRKSRRRSE